jgi:UDP-glucose 4-epimerase
VSVLRGITGGRFLVIGGAGFIGSHVTEALLASGASHVRIFDNFVRGTRANIASALSDPRAEVFGGSEDIRDRAALVRAMHGVDGVFHLAALWLLECVERPQDAFDVNVGGTMNVALAMREARVPRLVFSSSASVYGDAQTEPMAESHPFGCTEVYGASKASSELLLGAMARRDGGFGCVHLRYMNVYGPRQDDRGAYVGVVTRMMRDLEAGSPPTVDGDGSQAYDFVDVRDCARANLLAMASGVRLDACNVGTGIKTSILGVADLIARVKGFSGPIQRRPLVARPFVRNRVGDVRHAQAAIGFRALVGLEQGIRHLSDWRGAQAASAGAAP